MVDPAQDNEEPSSAPVRFSIATYLGIGLGGLIATALGLLLWVTLSAVFKNTTELLNDKSRIFLGSLSAQTRQYLDATLAPSKVVASEIANGRVDPHDDAQMLPLMRTLLAATPQVTAMAFFDIDGTRVASYRDEGEVLANRQSWTDDEALSEAMADAEATGEIAWGPPINEPYIGTFVNLRRPVFRGETYLGTSTAVINVQVLSAFLDSLETEIGQNAFILYDRDYVLAHRRLIEPFPGLGPERPLPRVDEIGDPVLARIWAAGWEENRLVAGSGHADADDPSYIYLYSPLIDYADAPWLIGSYFPADTIAVQVERMIAAVVGSLLILVLTIAAVYLFGRYLRQPVQALAEAAAAVRDLDLERVPRLPPSRFTELDQAGRAFNGMVGALRSFSLYVPKTLVRRLMARGEVTDIRSERRLATVLMTDIVGFTTLAETMSAEETAAFLNEHLALVTACIEAEGGVVDKFMGDAVMALWGALEPETDHGERAVRAGLRIRDALSADNRAQGRSTHLRIGIHSGDVIAGNLGTTTRMNYTVVGDSVNMAQRLEALGKILLPDAEVALLISAATRQTLPPSIETRSLGRHALRGRAAEVEVFVVVADGYNRSSDKSRRPTLLKPPC
ncbi:MAG: adenylate/guanylate cyclase domain-containing protein [Alphaproteobacteria bacterium]